ncbi:hypothetical protein EXIGLDRAFT_828873 [Exidia glandulosa HHB12029]|uniref:Putative ER transporter 6TM N-terminal domain-containing protein n=1 Tax=Exidia glandulosa HHB12029 TaxID=1314781 RepID=A0A165Q624_EXIGL|nr:hypothetical protein EXIGLDRAFT_828873 [Exidia glandulosa HHB12029]
MGRLRLSGTAPRVDFSREILPILKGALAYAITLGLILYRGFEDLNEVPIALATMIIPAITSKAGGTVGEMIQAIIVQYVGMAVGGLLFYGIAHLHSSHVAQGFILFVFVYVAALVRAVYPVWFPGTLFALLTVFYGLLSSVVVDGYDPANLRSYLAAQAWGGAVSAVVNLLILPRSSEKQMRRTLVASIHRLRKLSRLISATYMMTITDEERGEREELVSSIRADFALLNDELSGTFFELNISRFSVQDYSNVIRRIRALQIASLSACSCMMEREWESLLTERLQDATASFETFRRSVDIIYRDSAACLIPQEDPLPALDVESVEGTASPKAEASGLSTDASSGVPNTSEDLATAYAEFEEDLRRILAELVEDGTLSGGDDSLHIRASRPSVWSSWQAMFATDRSDLPTHHGQLIHHSLISIHSFIHSSRIFAHELAHLYDEVIEPQGKRRPRKLRLHWFPAFSSPESRIEGFQAPDIESASATPMTYQEALPLISNRPFRALTTTKMSWRRIYVQLENAFTSPTSIFALKTAAGCIAFAMLLFAKTTRGFATGYAVTPGVMNFFIAMSPTLGQSILVFVSQMSGAVIGSLWAVAVLEMFKGVGGYAFNPYGMVTLLAISALPFVYLIYSRPKYFLLGLLTLNVAGVLVVAEWMFVVHDGVLFDTPILQAGKAVAMTSVAVALAVIMQVILLPHPSRRVWRENVAEVAFDMLSYYSLFQSYLEAILPPAPQSTAPPRAAVLAVAGELERRETAMQRRLIALYPLIEFSAVEPHFIFPLQRKPMIVILQSLQNMLDRLTEARTAIGAQPVPELVTREFEAQLLPYRRQFDQFARAALFNCASSLACKAPLSSDAPTTLFLRENMRDFLHDAMVLSSRLARTEEGKDAIRKGLLTPYWTSVTSITSLGEQLIVLENMCRTLFGGADMDASGVRI